MRSSRRFVLCELTGGLGNQLFQYAAARALALRESRAVYFAWHLHRSSTARHFMLDHFQLGAEVERVPLSRRRLVWLGVRSPLAPRKAGRLWRRLRGGLHDLKETEFAYAPLASSAERVVLDGYFQSWRYFDEYAAQIRGELQLRGPMHPGNVALLREIESKNAICLHVRRGDYVNGKEAAAFHGALDLSFYRAGLASLGALAQGGTLYVFSDDPAWCKQHVQLDLPTVVVEPNAPDRPWEDLRVMSACRHFLIANSSFSWWGAWLAQHPDKRVVAPLRWFSGGAHDTRDLCPPAWTRL